MATAFYCYVYKDPSRNMEPFYVGKGKNKRAWDHLKRTKPSEMTHRIKKMIRNGVEPVIEFLCYDQDEEFIFLVEQEAIHKFGRKDLGKGPLLNLTDGGEGPIGFKPTPEMLANQSRIQKIAQRKSYDEDPGRKIRIKESNKQAWANEELLNRQSKQQTVYWSLPENVAKRKIANSNRDPESYAKMWETRRKNKEKTQ